MTFHFQCHFYTHTGQEKSGVFPSKDVSPANSAAPPMRRCGKLPLCCTQISLKCGVGVVCRDVTLTERHHWLEGGPLRWRRRFFLDLYPSTELKYPEIGYYN